MAAWKSHPRGLGPTHEAPRRAPQAEWKEHQHRCAEPLLPRGGGAGEHLPLPGGPRRLQGGSQQPSPVPEASISISSSRFGGYMLSGSSFSSPHPGGGAAVTTLLWQMGKLRLAHLDRSAPDWNWNGLTSLLSSGQRRRRLPSLLPLTDEGMEALTVPSHLQLGRDKRGTRTQGCLPPHCDLTHQVTPSPPY